MSVILFSGCIKETNTPIVKKQEPKWLQNPYIDNDKIASIGCARIHFKGKEAQKNLAISRAIDKIAVQKSVTVNNLQLRRKSVDNGKAISSSAESTSLHSVDNVKVSTKTKAIYNNKLDGEICAWVISR